MTTDEQMQVTIVPYGTVFGALRAIVHTVFDAAIGTSSYSRTAAEHGMYFEARL